MTVTIRMQVYYYIMNESWFRNLHCITWFIYIIYTILAWYTIDDTKRPIIIMYRLRYVLVPIKYYVFTNRCAYMCKIKQLTISYSFQASPPALPLSSLCLCVSFNIYSSALTTGWQHRDTYDHKPVEEGNWSINCRLDPLMLRALVVYFWLLLPSGLWPSCAMTAWCPGTSWRLGKWQSWTAQQHRHSALQHITA